MKSLIFILLFVSSLFGSQLEVVPYVNVQKFSGLWYEIARTYNSYQDKCVASSVEYVLQESNRYEVKNRCFDTKIGGELIEYEGTAKSALGGANMSKIDMTYFWIFTKRYEVLYLEDDYSSAVVSDKELEQLWIMSRTPKMQDATRQKILSLLGSKMDLKRLIFTPQDTNGRYK